MRQFSSFTFNSDRKRYLYSNGRREFGRKVISILLWTVGFLGLIDFGIGAIFGLPVDQTRPSTVLQNYFDYGRSIEGKLRRDVGVTPDQDAPIVKAGWLENECNTATQAQPGKISFDIYGMSFSNQIADHMERLDAGLVSQRFGGPSAPPNHSYACFIHRIESVGNLATIQIFGILASSLRRMETISGLTTSFEGPMPFTYPRYGLTADGRLKGYMPSITTPDDLRAALADPAKWRFYLNELANNDVFFARAIFQEDIFDQSVLGRLIRRAWGQRVLRDRTDALRAKGVSGVPDALVLRAMLLDFATKARAAGQRPIVLLIEDRGYGNALSSAAVPVLQHSNIEYVATSAIATPDDTSNFEADGHFTSLVNEKIARAVLSVLNRTPK
jgi:hypothetical protein